MFHSELDIRWGRIAILAFLLPMMAQTFQYFPIIGKAQEGWYAICFIYLVLPYVIGKAGEGWNLSSFDLYMIILMVITPILSGYSALQEFNQPVFYGALAARNIISISAVLAIENALRYKYITLRELEKALLLLAWTTWFLYICIRLILAPSAFQDIAGFVTGSGDTASFSLQAYFIIFGVLYYAFKGLRTGRLSNYVLAILLLAGAIGKTGGRSIIVAVLFTFFFFMARWLRISRLLILLPVIIISIGLLIGALYLVVPKAVADRFSKLTQAITVVLTGQQVEDVSANARNAEGLYAFAGAARHPWVGNGNLSNQFQTGRKSIMGLYFFPADVGIIGIVYVYGFAGLILFSIQYWFALRSLKGLPKDAYTPLMDAAKGSLLYCLLISLANGAIVFDAGVTLFYVVVLRNATAKIRSVDAALLRAYKAKTVQT